MNDGVTRTLLPRCVLRTRMVELVVDAYVPVTGVAVVDVVVASDGLVASSWSEMNQLNMNKI